MKIREYYNEDRTVLRGMDYVASAASIRLAKMIANALNLYRRKRVSQPRAAEKQK